jgi:hypothetical protein
MFWCRGLVRVVSVGEDTITVVFPGWDVDVEVPLSIEIFPVEYRKVGYRCHCMGNFSTDDPNEINPNDWDFS